MKKIVSTVFIVLLLTLLSMGCPPPGSSNPIKIWTWVSGSDVTYQSSSYGTKGQEDAANIPGARRAGGCWIKSGKFLWLFGGEGYDSVGDFSLLNDLWKITVR